MSTTASCPAGLATLNSGGVHPYGGSPSRRQTGLATLNSGGVHPMHTVQDVSDQVWLPSILGASTPASTYSPLERTVWLPSILGASTPGWMLSSKTSRFGYPQFWGRPPPAASGATCPIGLATLNSGGVHPTSFFSERRGVSGRTTHRGNSTVESVPPVYGGRFLGQPGTPTASVHVPAATNQPRRGIPENEY